MTSRVSRSFTGKNIWKRNKKDYIFTMGWQMGGKMSPDSPTDFNTARNSAGVIP